MKTRHALLYIHQKDNRPMKDLNKKDYISSDSLCMESPDRQINRGRRMTAVGGTGE